MHLVSKEGFSQAEPCQDSGWTRRMRTAAFQHHHPGFCPLRSQSVPCLAHPSFSAISSYCISMHKCLEALGFNVASSRGLPGPRPALLSQRPTWDSQMDSGKTTLITHGWILLASFLQVKEQLREENEDSSWDYTMHLLFITPLGHSACHTLPC